MKRIFDSSENTKYYATLCLSLQYNDFIYQTNSIKVLKI